MEQIYTVFIRYFFGLSIVIVASCNFLPAEKNSSNGEVMQEVSEVNENANETQIAQKETTLGDMRPSDIQCKSFTPPGTFLGCYFPPKDDFMPSEPNDTTQALSAIIDGSDLRTDSLIVDFPIIDAEFIGGRNAMLHFIAREMIYPITDPLSYTSAVYISFNVEIDGCLTNISVVRGDDGPLDREAKRLIQTMPKWKPAEDLNGPCRTRVRLPIRFDLM